MILGFRNGNGAANMLLQCAARVLARGYFEGLEAGMGDLAATPTTGSGASPTTPGGERTPSTPRSTRPRAGLPPAQRAAAGGVRRSAGDRAGQTNSQPRTVDDMLRLLDVRPGQRVLDVGAGSGWTTALLAHLTGATGSVRGVELEPELVHVGAPTTSRAAELPWASIRPARPGVLGLPDHAPYDRILVSAEPRHPARRARRPARRRG